MRPATTLCFLGIEILSRAQELRLPQEKLHCLKELLGQWKVATKQRLQSLLRHLGHAAWVVRPGRSFLRELIRTMSRPKHSYHKVCLNVQCKADIQWWNMFCHRWNGISFFQCNPPAAALKMFSDASGSWGCGGVVKDPQLLRFQLKWLDHWKNIHITAKELVPIIVGAAIWGHRWSKQLVRFVSDNMAVVQILTERSARDPVVSHQLRCLFFIRRPLA